MRETRDRIRDLVKEHFSQQVGEQFAPGKTRIPLNVRSYGWEEACEAIDSILSTQVTMGKKVREFEVKFAQYIGTRHAIMVNSGSSANLLVLSLLTNPALRALRPGDEVITPAVTWATTVFPIIQCGAVPVLVDVDPETFNILPAEMEAAITPRTRAIMLVHLLGTPCAMEAIMDVARRHNLIVIEDACEAHGAEYGGRKVGSFGDLATFSFFFVHHISTIEGGMVLTDRDEYAELARSLRAFGWIREMEGKEAWARRYPDIDPRYLFINAGYNFRPTEIAGGFGIHQLAKLEGYIALRRATASYWTERLSPYSRWLGVPREREAARNVWYGYPLTVKAGAPFSRAELVGFLEQKGVETRPIMAGNMDEQPALQLFPYRRVGELPNSRFIMRNSFFFGSHHGIGTAEREAIVNYVAEFMARKTG